MLLLVCLHHCFRVRCDALLPLRPACYGGLQLAGRCCLLVSLQLACLLLSLHSTSKAAQTPCALLQLAPGGHVGRFIIWTKSAFSQLDTIFGKAAATPACCMCNLAAVLSSCSEPGLRLTWCGYMGRLPQPLCLDGCLCRWGRAACLPAACWRHFAHGQAGFAACWTPSLLSPQAQGCWLLTLPTTNFP